MVRRLLFLACTVLLTGFGLFGLNQVLVSAAPEPEIQTESEVRPTAPAPVPANGTAVVDQNGMCFTYAGAPIPCPTPTTILTCANGVLEGTSCVIVGDAPVRGPATCPTGPEIIQPGCYRVVSPFGQPPQCPVGSFLAANDECRQPVALIPGPLLCSTGFALVGGKCVTTELPVTTLVCPSGFALVNDRCVTAKP